MLRDDDHRMLWWWSLVSCAAVTKGDGVLVQAYTGTLLWAQTLGPQSFLYSVRSWASGHGYARARLLEL